MAASISASSAGAPPCGCSPPRRMDHRRQDQLSCCSPSASSDQLLPSSLHRQPGMRVFQSCIQGKAAKQLLVRQFVLEVVKILDEEVGDDHDSNAAINKNERMVIVKEETPSLPLRTRTDSIQRIRRNLNSKRSSWQQVALRGRTKEARDHEATLYLLRDAAKRAAKRAMMDESTHSVASTRTDSSIDGDSVRASVLLEEARRAAGRPLRSSALSSRRGSGAAVIATSSSSDGVRGEAIEITRCISATKKIQALARGRACRRRLLLKRRREQEQRRRTRHLASFTKQQHKSYLPPPPSLSDSRRRVLEHRASDITMSDFGDSARYDLSTLLTLSSHHTIISILEADDEENDDDEEYDEFQLPRDDEQLPSSDDIAMSDFAGDSAHYDRSTLITLSSHHTIISIVEANDEGEEDDEFQLPRDDEQLPSSDDNWDHETGSLRSFEGLNDLKYALSETRSTSLPVSSSSRMVPAAIGFASFSSYFGTGIMGLGDTPIQRPERRLSSSSLREDAEEVSLPEVPSGEDHDGPLLDDDDVRPSCEDMRRSDEGSLNFFADLNRRPTTFRRPRAQNEGEGNYFLHSMSGSSSSSFSSRWDAGSVAPLPSPSSSLPPPEQQRIASKAANSTYLPATKLSNNMNTNSNNDGSNGSMDIVFLTLISVETSPKLPLRKRSTTPLVGDVDAGEVQRVSPVARNNSS